MGSGKSTIGALVAGMVGCPFQDLDQMIEVQEGESIREIFDRIGETGFRGLETNLLAQALTPGYVTALGGGAPLQSRNWLVVRERAFSIFLDAPFEVLWDRLGQDAASRPLLRGRTPEQIRTLYLERRPRYLEADQVVRADRAPEVVAEEVVGLWSG
jgi:shikimate kinase